MLLLLSNYCAKAQDLYEPRNIKQTYKNNIRDRNGTSGKNYWQNTADYDIQLNLAPPERTVTGSEEIKYSNNSPDTLKRLNFKLIINNHKPGAARLYQVGQDYLTEGIKIDKYVVNGEEKKWDDSNDNTNKMMKLDAPLPPGKSVDLTIDWHYKVSKQSGREGAIDSTTFFLAYFYPRVAVYDDYEGWDTMTFTGSQEFYNDFNNYKLEVTVPENYIVWATGDFQNPTEVLNPAYAELLEKSMTSDSIIEIAHQGDLNANKVTRDTTNTWKFTASNITDIAVAVSNHYNWDAGSVMVDSTTQRRASVQAAYDEESKDFQQMVTYGKHALNWLSNNIPGVPYPFSKSTIVRGFADMEYPMMVNDNSTSDPDFTRFVVEHEIAHTYFPFYMGINETRFGFMDEGWATTLEYLIGISDLGKDTAGENFKKFRVNRWINDPSMEEDLPIITPSNILSGPGLGNNEYGKAALGYLALKDLLGEEGFKTALQGYMKRWHGKHPTPWDFFYSINDVSGKNLNWFWNSWFFSTNYIDMKIENVSQKGRNTLITIKNIGGMPAPVDILVSLTGGETKTIHQSPAIWKENLDETTIVLKNVSHTTQIQLEGGIFMDASTSDNTWNSNSTD
ncbi:MAG TPA: M1 family peptidase [Leeuwenhoekiella sp.]|nr:M1 family peptidase [Leeuwenhoekiella sp.]